MQLFPQGFPFLQCMQQLSLRWASSWIRAVGADLSIQGVKSAPIAGVLSSSKNATSIRIVSPPMSRTHRLPLTKPRQ